MQNLNNHNKNSTYRESSVGSISKFFAVTPLQPRLSKIITIFSLLFFSHPFAGIGVLAETSSNNSAGQLRNPLYREGLALIEARDYKSAVDSLTLFLEENPSSDKGYHLRGKAYHEIGSLDKASVDYNQAIKLNTESYKSYNNLGLIYGRIKKFELAKKTFSKAIKINPQPKEALNNRGVAKAATGDPSGAINDFTKSIEIDEKYLEPLLNRSFVLEMQGELKRACDDWEQASLLGSKNAKIWHKSQCKQANNI